MALASFFVCPPLGLVGVLLGVVAYRAERRRGLALWAILLSLLSVLVAAVLAFLMWHYFGVLKEIDRTLK